MSEPTCPGSTSIDYEGTADLDCQRSPHPPDELCRYADQDQEVLWRYLKPGYRRAEVEAAWRRSVELASETLAALQANLESR